MNLVAVSFVRLEKFVEALVRKLGDIRTRILESNTPCLATTNLALRNIDEYFGAEPADTFRCDHRPDQG